MQLTSPPKKNANQPPQNYSHLRSYNLDLMVMFYLYHGTVNHHQTTIWEMFLFCFQASNKQIRVANLLGYLDQGLSPLKILEFYGDI